MDGFSGDVQVSAPARALYKATHGNSTNSDNTTYTATRRADGRMPQELRRLALSLATLKGSSGSSRLALGSSLVVAGANGPSAPERARDTLHDRAFLAVEVVPSSGLVDHRHAQCALRVKTLLDSTVALERFPRTQISVAVHVMADDGSLFELAFNAAVLALVDAGIPLSLFPVAVDAAVVGSTLLVDPTLLETQTATALVSSVYAVPFETKDTDNDDDDDKDTTEKQDGKKPLLERAKDVRVLSVETAGPLAHATITESVDAAKPFALAVADLFRESFTISSTLA